MFKLAFIMFMVIGMFNGLDFLVGCVAIVSIIGIELLNPYSRLKREWRTRNNTNGCNNYE